MLIIDIKNQRVNSSQLDPDVVVLKGASTDLINSLQKITLTAGVTVLQPPTASPAVVRASRKVGLGSSRTPVSTLASAEGDFNDTFAQLSRIINQAVTGVTSAAAAVRTPKKAATTKVLQTETKNRTQLAHAIATALIGNASFVETLRTTVQSSTTLNASQNLPTTRNIQTAIALYAHYGTERSFSSTVGASQIASAVSASSAVVARLATDFTILSKKGTLAASRYFVSKQFEATLLTVLQQPKFAKTLAVADAFQDQLDALGTLRA
jgi:hypothetical protein